MLLPLAAQPAEEKVRTAIVETAKSYLGVPYVYGAESPQAFDCSGFVRYVYREAAGIELPRSSKALWAAGRPASMLEAKSGDVVVFDTVGGAPSHVGIILDGETFIHALSDVKTPGVAISRFSGYWQPLLLGVRVYLPAGSEPPVPLPRAREPVASAAPAASGAPVASAAPEKKPAPKAADEAVSVIGFTVTGKMDRVVDPIPARVGTAIQYAVTNGTGADGTFEVLLYKMDKDPAKSRTLRRERLGIPAKGMRLAEPYTFDEPGRYRLVVKTHDNYQRIERVWDVVALRQ